MKVKIVEYVGVLEKYINIYNLVMKKRVDGEMCGEERLFVEKYLFVDER